MRLKVCFSLCLLSVIYSGINAAEKKSLFARLRLQGLSTGSSAPAAAASPAPKQLQPKKSPQSSTDLDEDFMECSAKLPDVLLLLIARYYAGTKEDGVDPLMVNALRSSRVIAHCPAQTGAVSIQLCDSDPRLMMLSDHSHDMHDPVINTFNVETGERILVDQRLSATLGYRQTPIPDNGIYIPWTYHIDEATQERVFTKRMHVMMPEHTIADTEERRFPVGFLHPVIKVGVANQGKSSMDLALLQHDGGNLWINWVFNRSDEPVRLQPDAKKEALNIRQRNVEFIVSDDRARIGIVFPREIVLFDGATGIELTRCRPPQDFSFLKKIDKHEKYDVKICTMPALGEEGNRYELAAFVQKTGVVAPSQDRYIRWDLDEKAIAQNTHIREGYSGFLACEHIFESGRGIAWHNDVYSKVVICDPVNDSKGKESKSLHTLWKAGDWNELGESGYSMDITQSRSHLTFYGRSPKPIASDDSLYEWRTTTLHFDPTILYAGDPRSLLQRIQVMRRLCLSAHEGDTLVTLSDREKELFSQLHPRVRHNFQTTMRIQGLPEEPTVRASRIPILPPLTLPERKDDKKQRGERGDGQHCSIQ